MKGIKLISIKLTWGNLPWRKISATSTVYSDSGNACIHFVLFYLTQKYVHQWHFILSEPHIKVADSFGGRSHSWTASFKPGIQHVFPASALELTLSGLLRWPWGQEVCHVSWSARAWAGQPEHYWQLIWRWRSWLLSTSGQWRLGTQFSFPFKGYANLTCFSTSL